MTASGGAYSRFRRSLDNGNLLAARAAAIELKHVGLAEALESIDGSQIEQACEEYGVEFVGPLPDEN